MVSSKLSEDTYAKLSKGHQILGGNKFGDIRRFLKSRHTKKNIKIGAALGTVVGGITGASARYNELKKKNKDKLTTKEKISVIKHGLGGAGAGALLGGVAGAVEPAKDTAIERGKDLIHAAAKRAQKTKDILTRDAARILRGRSESLGQHQYWADEVANFTKSPKAGELFQQYLKHGLPKSRWEKTNQEAVAKLAASKNAGTAYAQFLRRQGKKALPWPTIRAEFKRTK